MGQKQIEQKEVEGANNMVVLIYDFFTGAGGI